MSHFTVLVVTDGGTEAELAAALQPFHEFECTGVADEHVQNVDKLAEGREEYAGQTRTMLRAPDGALHNAHDARFYRKPTPEERAKEGPFARERRVVPDGWEEVELPASQVESLADFIAGWFGFERLGRDDAPDLSDKHKYGWVRVDERGEVIEAIDRTNPNKKWDWWAVGGRWPGQLMLKSGEKVDGARWLDVDLAATLRECAPRQHLTFAILKDGRWHERGEMHWFAVVVDEKDDAAWAAEYTAVLETIHPDQHVTVVDCHI